jgi:hypothetical protein
MHVIKNMADHTYEIRIKFDTRSEADSFIQKKLSKTPFTLHRIEIPIFIVIAINAMDQKTFTEFKTYPEAYAFINEQTRKRKIKYGRIQEMTMKEWAEMQPQVQAQRQANFRRMAAWVNSQQLQQY